MPVKKPSTASYFLFIEEIRAKGVKEKEKS